MLHPYGSTPTLKSHHIHVYCSKVSKVLVKNDMETLPKRHPLNGLMDNRRIILYMAVAKGLNRSIIFNNQCRSGWYYREGYQ